VIQEVGLYVYNMHNIVEVPFSITIAPVRYRDGSLVIRYWQEEYHIRYVNNIKKKVNHTLLLIYLKKHINKYKV
jgi:hypothetical protein